MEYRVLGPLEVLGEDGPLPLGGAKQRALLALLLLNANRVVARERLIDELWPDDPPETAVTTVQVYVSRLRKLLPEGTLLTRAPGYLLRVDPDTVDLGEFEALLAEARGAEPVRASEFLRDALALWRGRALAEFGEPFAQVEGSRLEDLRLSALEERIDADLALGREFDLIGELEALIAGQPHRERLRGQLMLALYRAGRQADALAAYRDARTALDELGIEPSEGLRRLEQQILTQDATLARKERTSNLPVLPTPLVGRTRELAAVVDLVRAHRLVTLTGAGGSGKTRLGLQASWGLLEDFADGVWFVSLASLRDPELVEAMIAETLGARGELKDFLRGKHLLLVLDNLEQLLPEASAAVAGLEAKVLATSRERLNVSAEHEYVVPTLPLDDAVELFTQRARQLKPGFEPDEHVTELARRVDGLPLALELAAARVKLLSPRQIVERLGESLDLLSGGGRDLPERQRTLRATLEWSYGLLSDDERWVFARLGIFAGSFDVAMAEAIADATLEDLQSLLDKSLLVPRASDRFVLLETLRAFARERLAVSELETLRRAQFRLIAELAGGADEALLDGRVAWYRAIEVLLPDIREVLAWALPREPASAAAVICRLRPFLMLAGRVRESRLWLERVLAHRPQLPDELLAETLLILGWTRLRLNDPDAAAEPLRESIELFDRRGDRLKVATARHAYAHVHTARGRHVDALVLRTKTLRELREIGDEEMICKTLHHIGVDHRELGNHTEARENLEHAIALAERQLDPFLLGNALASLAHLEVDLRNLDAAEMLYQRSLETVRAVGAHTVDADCVAGLACIAGLRGERRRAGELWGRANAIEDATGENLLQTDRERYVRILAPVSNDAVFRRGYEAGRAAEAPPIADASAR